MTYFQATYHLPLVLLSIAIAVFASYSALHFYRQSQTRRGISTMLPIVASSLALGIGIWAAHLVGMLAVDLPEAIHYNGLLILGSALFPVAAAYAAFRIAAGRFGSRHATMWGGLCLGSAIVGTHAAGMVSMKTPYGIACDPLFGMLSVLIAYGVSFTTLKVFNLYGSHARSPRTRAKLETSLLLGVAIAGMHYTAMAGVRFGLPSEGTAVIPAGGVRESVVGAWIGISAVLVMALLLFSQSLDKRLALRVAERNKRRYDSIFQHNPDMVCLFDKTGQLMRANPASERMTGYPSNRLLRYAYKRMFDAGAAAAFEEAFQHVLRGCSRTIELDALHKEGRTLTLSMTLVPLLADGVVQDVYAISKDITAARLAERQLLAAKREADDALRIKSDFLAVLSHEIRTPLNGVIGMSDILMETELTEQQRQYVRVIQGGGAALLAVITDILDFTKMEAGKLAIQSEPYDLKGLLHDTIRVFTAQLREKQLYVQWEVEPDVPDIVAGDATRIRQVLLNLIGNAIKFTDEGGIQLTVARIGKSGAAQGPCSPALEFTVTDTGIGIRHDEQSALFQPFYQTEASIGRGGGTGLGLAICKTLVELMGGGIRVISEPGAGTSFSFTIPLALPKSGSADAGAWDGGIKISS